MKETILENGLTIVTDENKTSRVCTLGYVIKSGSYDEGENERGIAHLVEHMLFKGTINRDYKQIVKDIESIGGYTNAETNFEYTKFYCTVPSNEWEIGLDVLSDMMFNHTIPEDQMEKEKLVVQEELKMYNDDPSGFTNFTLIEKMFNKYPNRCLIGGTNKTVGNITRDDVIDFITRNYFPENMIFIATGNIDHDSVVRFVDNYINDLNIKFDNYQKQYDEFKPYKLNREMYHFEKNDIEQTHFCWGMFGPGYNHIDTIPLELLTTIIGGNCSSILYDNIREQKGLAYSIGMDIESLNDVSIINGYAGLNNNSNVIVNEITKEFKNLKQNINEERLNDAKLYLTGMMYIKLEKTSGVHDFLTNQLVHNNKDNIELVIEQINIVTIDDITRVIDTYFVEDNICFVELCKRKGAN